MATPNEAGARGAVASTVVLAAVCGVLALRLAVTAYGGVLHECAWPVRAAGAAAVFGLMFVLANAVLFRPITYIVMLVYMPFCWNRR